MQKRYISLGLMSGTSGDGVDASLINSDGIKEYESIKDKYYEYDNNIYKQFHSLKDKINCKKDLTKFSSEISVLEREITIFHARIIKDLKITEDFLVGFHGQTIYHNSDEKISSQLGDPKLLYQLIQKKIVSNFRDNDLINGGEGAPLVPIFHQLIATQNKINLPICIMNIGGISNITIINKPVGSTDFFSKDIGPGNCLIDKWVRVSSKNKFDINGKLASIGKKNEIILEQAQELFLNRINKKKSFDVSDFDISFARGLSLEDGAKTLTDFTARLIADSLSDNISKYKLIKNIILCGGGRKNKILINQIQKYLSSNLKLKLIDDYKIDGDFIESQAFGFLAIRTICKLPISYPNTTGCIKPTIGGQVTEN